MFNTSLGNLVVKLSADSSNFEKILAGAKAKMDRFSRALIDSGNAMSRAFTQPALSVASVATKIGADFDQAITSSLSKFKHLGDGVKKQMTEHARALSRKSPTGAVELAKAYEVLAEKNMLAAEAMGTLDVANKFAIANNISLTRSVQVLTESADELGIGSGTAAENLANLVKISDQMTLAANLANASVEEMGETIMHHAGSAAKNAKVPLEELMSLIATFSKQGVRGGQAGQLITDLYARMPLGNRRAAANAELRALGMNMPMLKKFNNELQKNSAGVTAGQYEDKIKSFNNQWEIFTNQLKDAGIDLFNSMRPTLEKGIGLLKDFVKAWRELSDSTKNWIVVIAAVVAASGPLFTTLGLLLVLIPQLVYMVNALFVGIAEFGYWLVMSMGWWTVWAALGVTALLTVTDALGVTDAGFQRFFNNISIGGKAIGTWIQVGTLHAMRAWDTLIVFMDTMWAVAESAMGDFADTVEQVFWTMAEMVADAIFSVLDAIAFVVSSIPGVGKLFGDMSGNLKKERATVNMIVDEKLARLDWSKGERDKALGKRLKDNEMFNDASQKSWYDAVGNVYSGNLGKIPEKAAAGAVPAPVTAGAAVPEAAKKPSGYYAYKDAHNRITIKQTVSAEQGLADTLATSQRFGSNAARGNPMIREHLSYWEAVSRTVKGAAKFAGGTGSGDFEPDVGTPQGPDLIGETLRNKFKKHKTSNEGKEYNLARYNIGALSKPTSGMNVSDKGMEKKADIIIDLMKKDRSPTITT